MYQADHWLPEDARIKLSTLKNLQTNVTSKCLFEGQKLYIFNKFPYLASSAVCPGGHEWHDDKSLELWEIEQQASGCICPYAGTMLRQDFHHSKNYSLNLLVLAMSCILTIKAVLFHKVPVICHHVRHVLQEIDELQSFRPSKKHF